MREPRGQAGSATLLVVAMAFGAQVENRLGLCSPLTSTLRMTCAAALVCPEFKMPRISSLSLTKESASSIKSVGRISSIYLKSALEEILLANSERGVRYNRMISKLVLPQRLVGLTSTRKGEISPASAVQAGV